MQAGGGPLGNLWVEVNLDAIKENIREIRNNLAASTKLLAVVKGNAYGLGIQEISRVIENDVDMLGVGRLEEALALRKAGIKAPILVLAPTRGEVIHKAIEKDIVLTVSSPESVTEICQCARQWEKSVRVHLEVDTGMGRSGLLPEQVRENALLLKNLNNIVVDGIYTHLADAAGRKHNTLRQFQLFNQTVRILEELGLRPTRHVCNSSAFLQFPEMHLDMVRIGTLLYGQYPAGLKSRYRAIKINNPWKCIGLVTEIRRLPAGSTIGYGANCKLRKETAVGFLPVGYIDGFGIGPLHGARGVKDFLVMQAKLLLSAFGKDVMTPSVKTLTGKPVSILGRIGMQSTLLDVSDLSEEEIAAGFELEIRRTAASLLLPRVYVRSGRSYAVSSYMYNSKEDVYNRKNS